MPQIAALGRGADIMLIALSYVLKQDSVDRTFARTIAQLTLACAQHFQMPAYLLVQDSSAPPYDRYNAFFAAIEEGGWQVDGFERRVTQPHRQVTPDGSATPQYREQNGNVVYRYGALRRAVY